MINIFKNQKPLAKNDQKALAKNENFSKFKIWKFWTTPQVVYFCTLVCGTVIAAVLVGLVTESVHNRSRITRTWGHLRSVGHDTSFFSKLVLGYIETKFCNQIRIYFCSNFQNLQNYLAVFFLNYI